MRLTLGAAVDGWMRVAPGRARYGGGAADGGRRLRSTVRLPHHSDFLGMRWESTGSTSSGSGSRQVLRERPRCRVAGTRPRPLPLTAMNHVWAYDFFFDTCADGRALKCLTIVDEHTLECLAIDVAGRIRPGESLISSRSWGACRATPRYFRSTMARSSWRARFCASSRRQRSKPPYRPREAVSERRRRIWIAEWNVQPIRA